MIKKLIKEEKGSAIILVALGLTVFMGVSAVVLDAGLLYIAKSQLSNGVDAAVLAGAQELPFFPEKAVDAARVYGIANDLREEEINIEVYDNDRILKVSAERNIAFFFARFIGFSDSMVRADAVAQVAPIAGVNGAVPLGIEDFNFQFNEEYTLKVGAGESEEGWFGALALGGSGSKTYEENLTDGYEGIIRVGDVLDVETGNMSNPTKRAIDFRIEKCNHIPYCTAASFHPACPRLLKVPIIQEVGHKQVQVMGFAMFLVDEVEGQGTDNFITGRFIKTVSEGEIDFDGSDYGLYGVKLTQ
ncbi:Putative Flp pilus-assembly TadE/G-like [Natronincola peptidivorans]|uniref:Putative Flp pilus-assembly TadE/G-like n=1 Tax=Natronincola peptidivorans TaxID=426128 RepID=A0A1I0FN64_9FIRM|nr:Tad domain-containing protein [Natronincola peptidivorans]SET59785.1 Putative Flp pilus-assembly TadE/G-like [Natronincola peptidivorans]